MAGINASIQLQLVILGVGAYPMPYKLLIPHINNSFDDQSEPQNESVIKMTEKFLNEFLWFADALVKKKREEQLDRKSTRLNSSHVAISYAVFCLKKKRIRQQLS